MVCQKSIAARIVERGGDYIPPIKDQSTCSGELTSPVMNAETISRLRDMNQTDRITRWLYWTNRLPVRTSGILLHSSDVCGI